MKLFVIFQVHIILTEMKEVIPNKYRLIENDIEIEIFILYMECMPIMFE